MDPDLAAARALLQTHFGHPRFRPAQEPVLRSVLGGRDTLAVFDRVQVGPFVRGDNIGFRCARDAP